MQRTFTALVLASVLWAGLGPLPGSAMAAAIIVDDGATNSRPVASNEPAFGNVWNSMAQSFTAEDPSILFGFRLHDSDSSLPHAGASIIYNLYDGENSYSTLLTSKTVTLPNALSTDPRSTFGDVGFVDADFSNVTLVVGQKYTVEITVPSSALPATGSDTGFGVWTSLNDPYSGGRFFFPSGYDNTFFSQQDMLFRVTPVSVESCLGTGSSRIKGMVKAGRRGMPDVTLTLDGLDDCGDITTTDTKGRYTFQDLAHGIYTVTPSKEGCTFRPPSRELRIARRDVKANFKAMCP